MNPAVQADVVAGAHLAVVVFVVAVPPIVLLGRILGRQWLRGWRTRLLHLGIMGYIAQNAARGKLCFLTHWEWDLRERAGQEGAEGSFIGQLLHDILFVDVPQRVLDRYYIGFFVLVLLTFVVAPPRRRARTTVSAA